MIISFIDTVYHIVNYLSFIQPRHNYYTYLEIQIISLLHSSSFFQYDTFITRKSPAPLHRFLQIHAYEIPFIREKFTK